MEIQYLRYFKKVAELEHMTKASEELMISQPALSKNIKDIEKELNSKLFNRVGKNIVLNENGNILLKYTNLILNSLDDLNKELTDADNCKRNTVSFSMQAASKLLPIILSGFKSRYPEIKFAIKQHKDTSDCDLIINSSKDKITAGNLISLLEERILLAVPKDHILASRNEICLEELSQEKFISLQKGTSLCDITREYCISAGYEPNVILESDDPATIRGLISVGMGVCFFPAITWRDVADSNIKLLSITNDYFKRFINVSWNEDRYLSRSTILYRDYLIDFFRTLK